MDKKTINSWIMYHQSHKMLREKMTLTQISSFTGLDRRTVRKYAGMNEQEYESFLCAKDERSKLLILYEDFVKDKLLQLPDASSAQLHDWLKEHHQDFPLTSPRTVYNFVMWVRHKYHIIQQANQRDYFPVEELAYGAQGQVDFGQYIVRSDQGRKKVFFSEYGFITFQIQVCLLLRQVFYDENSH